MLYIVPFSLLHAVDFCDIKLRIRRMAESILQRDLVRTYLHRSEKSKSGVTAQDLGMALMTDIPELVEHGFMYIFDMSRLAGNLAVVSYFIIQHNAWIIWLLVLFPFLILASIAFRIQ